MLKVKPTVKAYLPADYALGAPMRYTFSHDTKESLAGLPSKQLYFGGAMNSMDDYKPGDRFHGANQEFVPASREIAPGIYLIVTRSVMLGDFNAYPPNSRFDNTREPYVLQSADAVGMNVVAVVLE